MGLDDEVQRIVAEAAKKLLADTRAAVAALPPEHPTALRLPESALRRLVAENLFPFVLVVADSRDEHYARRAWDPCGRGPLQLITIRVDRNPDQIRGLRFGGYGITDMARRHRNAGAILGELAGRTHTVADDIRDQHRKDT